MIVCLRAYKSYAVCWLISFIRNDERHYSGFSRKIKNKIKNGNKDQPHIRHINLVTECVVSANTKMGNYERQRANMSEKEMQEIAPKGQFNHKKKWKHIQISFGGI